MDLQTLARQILNKPIKQDRPDRASYALDILKGLASQAFNQNNNPLVPGSKAQTALSDKFLGPAFTAISPIEAAIDTLIRKGSPDEKAQSLMQTGPDIGGALQTRGVPGAVAFPVGLAASIAIPGAGEVGQIRKAEKALTRFMHPEDVGALDWAADIMKRKGLDQKAYKQAEAIIGRLSDGYGVLADTTTQATKKLQKLAGKITGTKYIPEPDSLERLSKSISERLASQPRYVTEEPFNIKRINLNEPVTQGGLGDTGLTVYRGEQTGYGKPFGSLIKTDKSGMPKTVGGYSGIPTTSDLGYATERFAGKGGTVGTYTLKPGGKVLSDPAEILKLSGAKDPTSFFERKGGVAPYNGKKIYEAAKAAGYDAVDLRKIEQLYGGNKVAENEIRILNQNAFTQSLSPSKGGVGGSNK